MAYASTYYQKILGISKPIVFLLGRDKFKLMIKAAYRNSEDDDDIMNIVNLKEIKLRFDLFGDCDWDNANNFLAYIFNLRVWLQKRIKQINDEEKKNKAYEKLSDKIIKFFCHNRKSTKTGNQSGRGKNQSGRGKRAFNGDVNSQNKRQKVAENICNLSAAGYDVKHAIRSHENVFAVSGGAEGGGDLVIKIVKEGSCEDKNRQEFVKMTELQKFILFPINRLKVRETGMKILITCITCCFQLQDNSIAYVFKRKENLNQAKSLEDVIKFLQQFYDILFQLKKNEVYHGDIKPSNIVYDIESKLYKLIDFDITTRQEMRSGEYGTDGFMAPEVQNNEEKEYNVFNADLYSTGRTIEEYCKVS